MRNHTRLCNLCTASPSPLCDCVSVEEFRFKLILIPNCVSVAMSQFRVFAGVLRGGRVRGSQWLRACGAGPAKGVVDRRNCSSTAVTGPSALTSNPSYVEEMYFSWLEDHQSVHKVTLRISTLFNHNLEI